PRTFRRRFWLALSSLATSRMAPTTITTPSTLRPRLPPKAMLTCGAPEPDEPDLSRPLRRSASVTAQADGALTTSDAAASAAAVRREALTGPCSAADPPARRRP